MVYLHSGLYSWNLWKQLIHDNLLPARTSESLLSWSVVGRLLLQCCSAVSDLCPEITIIWQLGTFAFDNLVKCCPHRMICINLRQYSSLGDLLHQNLSLFDQLVENQGSGIQSGQNCTLSLF